jgi:hypothetical protein
MVRYSTEVGRSNFSRRETYTFVDTEYYIIPHVKNVTFQVRVSEV